MNGELNTTKGASWRAGEAGRRLKWTTRDRWKRKAKWRIRENGGGKRLGRVKDGLVEEAGDVEDETGGRGPDGGQDCQVEVEESGRTPQGGVIGTLAAVWSPYWLISAP